MTKTVAVYLFPDVEVLDFAGPYEVFTTAARLHGRWHPGQPLPFTTYTVARTRQPIRARAGLTIVPDHDWESLPPVDVLIIPGGVVDRERQDRVLLDRLAAAVKTTSIIASVCTGSFLLAGAGLLEGKSATTHWEDIADLRADFPRVTVVEGVRWVDEGSIVTSAGIAAGIDMSLHLVARLAGAELAEATARLMDVPYRKDP